MAHTSLEHAFALARFMVPTHENTRDAGLDTQPHTGFTEVRRTPTPPKRKRRRFFEVNSTDAYCAMYPPPPRGTNDIFESMIRSGAGLCIDAQPVKTHELSEHDPDFELGPVGKELRIVAAKSADTLRAEKRAQANQEGRLLTLTDDDAWVYKGPQGRPVFWYC